MLLKNAKLSLNAIIWRSIKIHAKVLYKRNNKDVYIYKETIVYPAVNVEHNNNGVNDLYLLNNEDYVEILNFVEYTSM